MIIKAYNRQEAVNYAQKWAYKRNPKYYDFSDEKLGGDCTNFVSQCIFAGANQMNYTKIFGWYYISQNNRAPAWTSVEYLYNFLTTNKSFGPFGEVCDIKKVEIGDVIQLSFDEKIFSHSLIVTDISNGEILVSTHSFDWFNRNLKTYPLFSYRCIKIKGYRQ